MRLIYFYLVGKDGRCFTSPQTLRTCTWLCSQKLRFCLFMSCFKLIMWPIRTNRIIWSENSVPKTTNIAPKQYFLGMQMTIPSEILPLPWPGHHPTSNDWVGFKLKCFMSMDRVGFQLKRDKWCYYLTYFYEMQMKIWPES